MVASTIHEFGHASHFQSVLSTPGSDRNKNYKRAENKMVESYAVTVEYYISSLIYGRTKAGDLLQHGSHPDYTKVGPSLICNGVTVEDLQIPSSIPQPSQNGCRRYGKSRESRTNWIEAFSI